MNSSVVSSRFARGILRLQTASFHLQNRQTPLLYRNQLRLLSESKISSKQQSLTTPNAETTASKSTLGQLRQFFDKHKSALSSTGGRDDASLARYPNMKTPGGMLRGADYAGTLTFALTGTITAAQSGLDVFGSIVVGIITSVGGGTVRDAIFLNRKPFWTEETEYIWMGIFTGLVTFYMWPQSVLEWKQQKEMEKMHHRQPQNQITDRSTPQNDDNSTISIQSKQYDTVDGVLDTLDAIGLSAFAIIGAQNGIRANMPLLVSAICGMATATFGGMIRDVICGRPVRIVHSNAEVYAPPALAGATVYLAAKTFNGSPATRIGAAFAVCMGSRFWAVVNDVKLPTWDIYQDKLGVAIRKEQEQQSKAVLANSKYYRNQ